MTDLTPQDEKKRKELISDILSTITKLANYEARKEIVKIIVIISFVLWVYISLTKASC